MAPAVSHSANCAARRSDWSESHTTAGWTVGAGAEFGLAQNWTAKIEYLYVDLNSSNFTITAAPNNYRFGLIRAGINYRF